MATNYTDMPGTIKMKSEVPGTNVKEDVEGRCKPEWMSDRGNKMTGLTTKLQEEHERSDD